MNALFSKSPNGSTLSGMNIAMVDLHSTRFADRILNAGVSSLSIIETSQHEAQKAKVSLLLSFDNFCFLLKFDSLCTDIFFLAWYCIYYRQNLNCFDHNN